MKKYLLIHTVLICVLFACLPLLAQNSETVTLVNNFQTPSPWGDIWVDGDLVFLGDNSRGFMIVDVSNPAETKTLAEVNIRAQDIKIWRNHAYVGNGSNRVWIVDIRDPQAPVVVADFQDDAHNLFVVDDYLYTEDLDIYDVSDPSNPVKVRDEILPGCHDITIIDDRLFAFHIGRGGFIFDLSDRKAPRQLANWTYPNMATHSGWPTEDGNFLITCDETTGGHVRIWDIRDLDDIEQVASYQTNPSHSAHNVLVEGDFAYVSYYASGLRILDVSDPSNPVEVGVYETLERPPAGLFDGAWGVYPFGELIHVSDQRRGLFTFNFSLRQVGLATGIITDELGQPVAGAKVWQIGNHLITHTGADGRYTLRMAAGERTIAVTAQWQDRAESLVTIIAGETVEQSIMLQETPNGFLEGTVRSRQTNQVIPGASLYIQEIDETLVTNNFGRFMFRSFAGTQHIALSAFGYEPDTLTAEVIAGQTTTTDLLLDPLARGAIGGTVTDAATGQGIAAKIELYFNGERLETTQTDVSGGYSFVDLLQSAAGQAYYDRIEITPLIVYPQATITDVIVLPDETQQIDVELSPAEVLLLDDDNGLDTESETIASLQELGRSHFHWDLAARPALADTLNLFKNAILMYTAADEGNSLADEDNQNAIKQYLDQGGHAVIASDRLGEQIGSSDFYRTYLHAAFERNGQGVLLNGVAGDPITDGMSVIALSSQNDILIPVDEGGTFQILTFPTGEPAAIRHESSYKLVYLGFSLYNVVGNSQTASREQFLSAIFDWFEVATAVSNRPADEPTMPHTIRLGQNYPNPFRPGAHASGVTVAPFDLDRETEVQISIFNLMGQRVRTLLQAKRPAGRHRVAWDGLNSQGMRVPPGIYFFRLQTGNMVQVRKFVLMTR